MCVLSARSAAVDVERHLAAEEAVGAEPAEHQVGVGHGRLRAAAAVAGRAGHRAGALRADAQRAVLDARDRAAAGADLENVHHGDLHRQRLVVAADQRLRGGQRLALVDDAGLGGGAAHVEGDGVVEPSVWHSACVPMTPAAGPDSSMRMHWLCACSAS